LGHLTKQTDLNWYIYGRSSSKNNATTH